MQVGNVAIGGAHPVRIQSMLTCDTMDTSACIAQTQALVQAGCEIVRLTAPTVKEAANLQIIHQALEVAGCAVPLVADIHFKPQAALEAAKWVEKVRINPGNFVDKKKFLIRTYTEKEYEDEIAHIRASFLPFVRFCKENHVAVRIGTNHGSLSDRIMNRYGDSPQGMVESALEFANIAREEDFHELVFSMKSSNPKVMIAAYRLLASRLRALGSDWNYPLHLGVTEAGDGEDGRIKSAIGIGSLLLDGIGETIRVSLTEDSVQEIPVAHELLAITQEFSGEELDLPPDFPLPYDPFIYQRRSSMRILINGVYLGGNETIRVVARQAVWNALSTTDASECPPEIQYETSGVLECDPRDDAALQEINASREPLLVTVANGLPLRVVPAFRLLAVRLDKRHAILLKDVLKPEKDVLSSQALLIAASNLGSLLCDGIGDAVLVQGESAPLRALRLAYNILQATGVRIFKTDYVACPSCGRTLFDLQSTTARIKAATEQLTGVKIAIMGCIVNGPGEMADADFGYVGGAPGKVNLYVGKTPVKFHIPEAEAVERLIDLIKEHNRWMEPTNKNK